MRIWILVSAMGSLFLSACDGGPDSSAEGASIEAVEAASEAGNDTGSEMMEGLDAEHQAPTLTGPQANALRSAKQYLDMTGFSREGLIQQLSSDAGDGYSVEDATVAVDNLSVDWNDNAVKSAKQYLSMTGFSCDGLIQQLSSSSGDKYTVEQATYGANQAGAC